MTAPNLEHIVTPLRQFAVPISDLTPDPKNVRIHSKRNRDALRVSLTKYGFIEPIIVQRQGMIIRAGNCRTKLAGELGWTHVPALIVDHNDVEATAFAITHNRTGELGEWDEKALAQQLAELQASSIELFTTTGFDAAEVDRLLGTPLVIPDDPVEELTPPDSFPEIDGTEPTDHRCPSCGYEWNGKSK